MMRLRSPAVWSSAPPPPPPSCHGNLWVISSPIYWLIFHQTPRHSTVLLAAAATVNWHQPSIMRRARRHLNTKNYSGAWEFCPVQAPVFIVLKWSSLWFLSSSGWFSFRILQQQRPMTGNIAHRQTLCAAPMKNGKYFTNSGNKEKR